MIDTIVFIIPKLCTEANPFSSILAHKNNCTFVYNKARKLNCSRNKAMNSSHVKGLSVEQKKYLRIVLVWQKNFLDFQGCVGCLVEWLVSWLVGWLVGRLVGGPVFWVGGCQRLWT